MKGFMESRKGLLFSALFFTGVCLLYVITALRRGLYEVLQFPSPMANIILFSGFLTLAVICWYRYLRYRPDREEFRHKKNAPLWAGMAVLCLLLAIVWLLLFLYLGRSAAALALCILALILAAVSVGRALKSRRK